MTKFVKSEGYGVIYCCSIYIEPFRTVYLPSVGLFKNRRLQICVCPVCGALIAELTQFNCETESYETIRPKRKKVAKFLKQMEVQKWFELDCKYATKQNAGFVYGINKQMKNGDIYQFSVDFNGKKDLVKIIKNK